MAESQYPFQMVHETMEACLADLEGRIKITPHDLLEQTRKALLAGNPTLNLVRTILFFTH